MSVSQWDANQWSAIAAIGSAVTAFLSLLVACVSLGVAWNTRQIQGKSADFSNCIDVVEKLGNAMRLVRDAEGAVRRFELIELLNLFEALATLHNAKKIAPSTKTIVCKFLEESLAWIRTDDAMKKLMEDSRTGKDTYKELRRFEDRNREVAQNTKTYAIQKGLR